MLKNAPPATGQSLNSTPGRDLLDRTEIEVRWLSFDADAPLDPCFLAALDDEERMQAA